MTSLLAWLRVYQPAPTEDNPWPYVGTLPTPNEACSDYYNHHRIDYMIDDVLPHEYAHALMFVTGNFSNENGGHTLKWQNMCIALEGLKCDRFVDHNDIVIGKTDFLY